MIEMMLIDFILLFIIGILFLENMRIRGLFKGLDFRIDVLEIQSTLARQKLKIGEFTPSVHNANNGGGQ